MLESGSDLVTSPRHRAEQASGGVTTLAAGLALVVVSTDAALRVRAARVRRRGQGPLVAVGSWEHARRYLALAPAVVLSDAPTLLGHREAAHDALTGFTGQLVIVRPRLPLPRWLASFDPTLLGMRELPTFLEELGA